MARKLHEYLGAQTQIFTHAERLRKDLTTTFDKKPHLFRETLVQFTPLGENGKTVTEAQSALQTTVAKELKWLSTTIAKALDTEATIDEGNTKARADVILDDGTKLLTDVPATQLMQLAKRLGDLQSLVQTIPTLDPAKGFKFDTARGVYQARVVQKKRTSKQEKPIVLYDATEKFPAQTQLITQDVVIGVIEEQEWSGLITPVQKSAILDRIEELLRAVKQAKARANDIQIDEIHVGSPLLDYIFAPALAKE